MGNVLIFILGFLCSRLLIISGLVNCLFVSLGVRLGSQGLYSEHFIIEAHFANNVHTTIHYHILAHVHAHYNESISHKVFQKAYEKQKILIC